MTARIDSDLRLAHHMADVAAGISLSHFRRDPLVRTKPDGSPVSAADLAVDRALIDILRAERPEDSILTEESGQVSVGSSRRWLIDPIDGTGSFIDGGRHWGTHIALQIDGDLVAAVMTRPTENLRWWAALGRGSYMSSSAEPMATDRPRTLSKTTALSDARVGGYVDEGSAAATALAGRATWVEDDVSLIGALLDGRLEAVVDDGGCAWDHAPAALLVIEAGGVFRDPLGGRRLDLAWGLYTTSHLEHVIWDVLAT